MDQASGSQPDVGGEFAMCVCIYRGCTSERNCSSYKEKGSVSYYRLSDGKTLHSTFPALKEEELDLEAAVDLPVVKYVLGKCEHLVGVRQIKDGIAKETGVRFLYACKCAVDPQSSFQPGSLFKFSTCNKFFWPNWAVDKQKIPIMAEMSKCCGYYSGQTLAVIRDDLARFSKDDLCEEQVQYLKTIQQVPEDELAETIVVHESKFSATYRTCDHSGFEKPTGVPSEAELDEQLKEIYGRYLFYKSMI